MLSIEEIKKACQFAEGFTINDDCIIEPVTVGLYESDLQDRFFREIIYPLLLQRVIEGVSKKTGIKIESYPYYFRVYKDGDFVNAFSHDEMSIDIAKEIMIKYILEKLN